MKQIDTYRGCRAIRQVVYIFTIRHLLAAVVIPVLQASSEVVSGMELEQAGVESFKTA